MSKVLILPSRYRLEEVWGKVIPTPSDKGYPNCFDYMLYWVLIGAGGEPVAYTGSRSYASFTLVGNTYVKSKHRKQGSHSLLLAERNKRIKGIKVTVLNPIEESNMSHLAKVVTRLGYTKVESYEGVEDIMSRPLYEQISFNPKQQVWRLDTDASSLS